MKIKYILLTLLWVMCFPVNVFSDWENLNTSPIHLINNPYPQQSLVNSVDFHPSENKFCVTFTQNHSVIIYKINDKGRVSVFQVLDKPESKIRCPQHAVFSKDGLHLIVINWCNQTFNLYEVGKKGVFKEEPVAIVSFAEMLPHFRPHGIAFSSDSKYVAVAFGASKQYAKGVALYRCKDGRRLKLLSMLQNKEIINGIPKGVAFTPDDSSLIVTLSEINAVAVYPIDWVNKKIIGDATSFINGPSTMISRPEDIKFTCDGTYCAVSNSDVDTVTFYEFDKTNNCFANEIPCFILQNPESQLCFPHGLAFSSDGKYLAITQFGSAIFDEDGNLTGWGSERKDLISIYQFE